MRVRPLAWLLLLAAAAPGAAPAMEEDPGLAGAVERGEYLFQASGGCSCHTPSGGPLLAGGRALETPFGVFYSTNITPDVETGIGGWSEADFFRAMRLGEAPDGSHFYPVFPYAAFTRMSDADLRDLQAYLFSLPAVEKPNRPHEVSPPISWRWSAAIWNALFLEVGAYQPDPERSEEWNRGAYLSVALAHCGECHTPRTLLLGLDPSMHLAGSAEAPEGELAPNITPDDETGIGEWSRADLRWFLQTGFKPDGDDAQGLMRELIDQGYRHLTTADLNAIATYLGSLPAIHNRVQAPANAD